VFLILGQWKTDLVWGRLQLIDEDSQRVQKISSIVLQRILFDLWRYYSTRGNFTWFLWRWLFTTAFFLSFVFILFRSFSVFSFPCCCLVFVPLLTGYRCCLITVDFFLFLFLSSVCLKLGYISCLRIPGSFCIVTNLYRKFPVYFPPKEENSGKMRADSFPQQRRVIECNVLLMFCSPIWFRWKGGAAREDKTESESLYIETTN